MSLFGPSVVGSVCMCESMQHCDLRLPGHYIQGGIILIRIRIKYLSPKENAILLGSPIFSQNTTLSDLERQNIDEAPQIN